jgi:hypothetical protein
VGGPMIDQPMNVYEVTFRLDCPNDQMLEAKIDLAMDGPFQNTNASVSYVCVQLGVHQEFDEADPDT